MSPKFKFPVFLLVFVIYSFSVSAQGPARPLYVLVHGAWGGSYAFKKVDSILTEKGCKVYRVALTGQGERAHLASPDISLSTHINDVVNKILYEDLRNVILVGHSYGGMVITGVADSIPDRIRKMVYVDAFLPSDGESAVTLFGGNGEAMAKSAVNGFIVPVWVKATQPIPKDVPQSLKTFTEVLHLKRGVSKHPTHYILTVAKGRAAEKDDFAKQADRARKRNIPVDILEADHNPQVTAISSFSDMLYKYK
ncbi:MAG: alpha/beta hydrolase [Pedobacter sp.]|nr:MAG: alpha/beta hydrolase [Pedobacter sp.]